MKKFLTLLALVAVIAGCSDEPPVRNTRFSIAGGLDTIFCDASSQTKKYTVYSDFERWRFDSDASWVSVLPHDAENDCKFTVQIGENPDTLGREACLSFVQTASGDTLKTVRIVQEPMMPLCSQAAVVDRMVFSTCCAGAHFNALQTFGYLPEINTVFFAQGYRTYSNIVSWTTPRVTTDTARAPHSMLLNFFSHGNNISFEYTKSGEVYLWAPNFGTRQEEGDYDYPTVVSRVKLEDGGELDNTDAEDNYYFGIRSCQASLDFENGLIAVSDVKTVYVYSLSDLNKLPVTDVQLDYEITYGGGASGREEYTGYPVIKARDCRNVQPMYTIANTYKSRGLKWQTFRIGGGRLYEFTQNAPNTEGPVVYESFLEVYDLKTGTLLYSKVPQEYTKDQDWYIERGFTNASYFLVEPEDLLVRDGTLYMMYNVRGNVNPQIRRPVVFKISTKIK